MKLFLAGLATGALVMLGAVHLADKWAQQDWDEMTTRRRLVFETSPDGKTMTAVKCLATKEYFKVRTN